MRLAEALGFLVCLNVAAVTDGDTFDSPEPASIPFFEDFNVTTLDSNQWLIAQRQWAGSGVNAGVVGENVSIVDGHLLLEAHGDLYDGPVRGINKAGVRIQHGRRVGAAIATKQYFGSGRYEVRAKIAPKFGVTSAIFTLHYQELPADGLTHSNTANLVSNHEINIEFPGRPRPLPLESISFDYGLFNTWRGQRYDEFHDSYVRLEKSQDDGAFHLYRFDWHTGDPNQNEQPRVEFYIDDKLVHTSTDSIPTYAGRFWLSAWFPDKWAGDPNFDTTVMIVDWVRITPFYEANDERVAETYSEDGWVALTADPGGATKQSDKQTITTSESVLKIADFDSQRNTNLLGGRYRNFYLLPSIATIETTSNEYYGISGRSLQVTYTSTNRSGNGGFWMRLAPDGQFLDAKIYRSLTFLVKGEKSGENFDIGLADRKWDQREDSKLVGNIRDFLPDGVRPQWQKVVIPLASSLQLDRSQLSGVTFICGDGEGTFYLDDIQFEK